MRGGWERGEPHGDVDFLASVQEEKRPPQARAPGRTGGAPDPRAPGAARRAAPRGAGGGAPR